MSTEIIKQSFDIAAPQEALNVAAILQQFVTEKKLTSNIKGKNYPLVEAWQFAGSQLGLYPLLIETKDLSKEGELKYMATVEIRRISSDQLVSRGVAICSNKEGSKRLFDEYAILSMAQTRAEGKAFRMLLSWLMKAAGFEATPAEEMDFANDKKAEDNYLVFWQESVNNCRTENDLSALWDGNKATCVNDQDIIAMFKKRKAEILKPVKK